jgi:hypothetical protein
MSTLSLSKAVGQVEQLSRKLMTAQQELDLYKRRYEYVKSLTPETFGAILKASNDTALTVDQIIDSWTTPNE